MEEKKKPHISNKLEETESRLYNRNKEPKPVERHELHDYHKDLPRSWGEKESMGKKKKDTKTKKRKHLMQSSGFRQIMFVAGLFFLGSVVFALLTFFRGGTTVSNNNIDIIVLGNSFVDGGEELPLQVKVANRNRTALEIADLLVEYSRGAGGSSDVVRERISLGEIGVGDVAEDIIDVVVFGQQGTVRDITFTLEYRVDRSNAIFVKEYNYPVNIANSPVDVIIDGPSDIVSNQEFVTNITVTQNSTEVTENMVVMTDYPAGFDFISANPEPNFGDDVWVLGDLAPGAEREIEIQGKIRAQNGEERIITVMSGSQNPDDEQEIGVQFTSTPISIAVGSPFVSIRSAYGADSSGDFSIPSGQQTTLSLTYENELDGRLDDLEIIARFSGNGFDPDRVSVNQGFFNTNNNSIVWNSSSINNLDSISSGESGTVSFSIAPNTNVSNPVINISVDANAIRAGGGTQRETVEGVYSDVIRVRSNIQSEGYAMYNSGPFVNSGPLPPTVGQETTYTIVWSASSSSNNLENAEITAELPSYVMWKGQTYPSNMDIDYNSATREITWDIGDISSGSAGQQTAHFQVGITPSASQIGSAPNLVNQIRFEAEDAFAGNDITRNINRIDTTLLRDSGYNSNNDRVVGQ